MMFNALLMLWRGLGGRCPTCGYGHMFKTFFGLIEGCPACGLRFEGTGDQSTGAMGISLTITVALGFAGALILVWQWPDHLILGTAGLIGVLSIFQLFCYRVSRGFWIGILAITGAIHEDERRDQFFL
ncbi:MAG TPA: DUF983 domain-containing protein [Herpetosiphon sp.]|nr:DUF983 domain-containing protein [Herpetosiphon sp.]HBW52418.1 DUF983 domain-containing protein [Herpetosiphon sp.]